MPFRSKRIRISIQIEKERAQVLKWICDLSLSSRRLFMNNEKQRKRMGFL